MVFLLFYLMELLRHVNIYIYICIVMYTYIAKYNISINRLQPIMSLFKNIGQVQVESVSLVQEVAS